jgi:hypothetical protein
VYFSIDTFQAEVKRWGIKIADWGLSANHSLPFFQNSSQNDSLFN